MGPSESAGKKVRPPTIRITPIRSPTKSGPWVGKVPAEAGDSMEALSSEDAYFAGVSSLHEIARLPKEFRGLPNGHSGSHQFLVDDFVKACIEEKTPVNNVWDAARYVLPGIIAHDSALLGGALLEVPDFGDAPR